MTREELLKEGFSKEFSEEEEPNDSVAVEESAEDEE